MQEEEEGHTRDEEPHRNLLGEVAGHMETGEQEGQEVHHHSHRGMVEV